MVTLRVALGRYPWTAALLDGDVRVDGAELEFVDHGPTIIAAFRRMARDLAFDVCELAWHTYLLGREHGIPFTAIPVFPVRRLPHRTITVSAAAGIGSPKDLAGGKVALRGYTVTPGVWARAMLAHDFGVDVDGITWVLSAEDHVAAYRPPGNIERRIGEDLLPDLRSGAIQAAVAIAPPDGTAIVPLLADPAAGERAWVEAGLIPVNHVIVVRDDVLAANPGLAGALAEAFARAKERPAAVDPAALRMLGGLRPEQLVDGVAANERVLHASIEFGIEQHVLTAAPALADLFATT